MQLPRYSSKLSWPHNQTDSWNPTHSIKWFVYCILETVLCKCISPPVTSLTAPYVSLFDPFGFITIVRKKEQRVAQTPLPFAHLLGTSNDPKAG